MTNHLILLLCIMCLASCATTKQTHQSYSVVNLNSQWLFQKGEQGDEKFMPREANWQYVSLPHTTRIENKVIKPHDQQWQGVSYYKKSLYIEKEQSGNRVYIEFGAAMNVAEVFLNNKLVGTNTGGYLPFAFDITDTVQFGEQNNVLVKLNNMHSNITGPKPIDDLDFNTYGGLYRDAKLVFKPQLHITYPFFGEQAQSGGIFVKTSKVSSKNAEVEVKVHINNQSDTAFTYQVLHEVFLRGEVVKSVSLDQGIAANKDISLSAVFTLDKPSLWHPDSPHLYMLRTSLLTKGQVIQSTDTNFGIRKFHFDANNNLLINDEHFVLRGINYHQDYPYVGYAKSKQAEYRDAKLIKEAGFNFVRLSHYPHSPYFLDAANKLGIAVLNPMMGWQYYQATPEFEQNALKRCRDLIRRDRNHPSVLAWECSLNETDMPNSFVNLLHQVVKTEYPESYSAGWMDGFDIYIQARQHDMKHAHDTRPNKPYIVSEYGDWEYHKHKAGKNQKNWHLLPESHRDSRQLIQNGEKRLLQQVTNIHEAHVDNLSKNPIADAYWVMFDYNRGKFSDIESSGIGSIDRLPKLSYYYFQSQRSPALVSPEYDSGPMVFIASDWNSSSDKRITVFSNVSMVKLYLNGVEQAVLNAKLLDAPSNDAVNSPVYFQLDQFVKGSLEAIAYINGDVVASHKVETAGETKGIQITVADHGVPIGANDTVFVNATIVDAKGTNTLINRQRIKFYSRGGIEVMNPQNTKGVLSTKGISVALIKTSENFTEGSIWAELVGSDIKSNIVNIKYDVNSHCSLMSLPLETCR